MAQLAEQAADTGQQSVHSYPTCLLCGSQVTHKLWESKDKLFRCAGRFSHWRCDSCGIVLLHPTPSEEELSGYYPDYLTTVQMDDSFRQRLKRMVAEDWYGYAPASSPLSWVLRGVFRKLLTLPLMPLLSHLPRKKEQGRVLDIGCGSGGYLAFLSTLGWDCHGVEPGANSRAYARETLGLTMYAGPLEACRFPDAFFDVVTMWHVIEHLPDPWASLREIRRILKPDGVFLLSTPNVQSLEAWLFGRSWYALDPPRHLYLLTPRTVRWLLERSGFVITAMRSEHHPTTVSRSLLYRFEDWEWPRARAFAARWIRPIELALRACTPLRYLLGPGGILRIAACKGQVEGGRP